MTGLFIFSKDRAFQLEALLGCLSCRCIDINQAHIFIQYFASSSEFETGYRIVQESWRDKLRITWIRESSFKLDLIRSLAYCASRIDSILFLVDDCLIVRDFSLGDIRRFLLLNPSCLGYSLRLGYNTHYCYSKDCEQEIPPFAGSGDFLSYNWSTAYHDFAYPLEISSSLYRFKDIYSLLRFLPYKNPNTLEQVLSRCKILFRRNKPNLACCSTSIAFCAPLNRVQNNFQNRAGESAEYSPHNLNQVLLNGERLDILSFSRYRPKACHEEISLKVIKTSSIDLGVDRDSIAVLMCALADTPTKWLVDSLSSTLDGLLASDSIYLRIDGGELNADSRSAISKLKYKCNLFIIEDPCRIGLPSGLNSLIDIALREKRYKYFARMDADDISFLDRFKFQRDFLNQHGNVDIVGSFCDEMTEDMKFIKVKKMPITHREIVDSLAWRNSINHPTVMMRSTVFERGFRYKVDSSKTEDFHLWITLASNGYIFENMSRSTIYFRRNVGVLKRRSGMKQFLADWEVRRRASRILGIRSFTKNILAICATSSRLLPVFLQKTLYWLR